MSEVLTFINNILKYADKHTIKTILDECIFTDRQLDIFKLKYIHNKDIDYISNKLNFSRSTVNRELKIIRRKIEKLY